MILRMMTEGDLPALIDLQRAGAIVGLADVLPQDLYPFPSGVIASRWRTEINDQGIETYVAIDDNIALELLAPNS